MRPSVSRVVLAAALTLAAAAAGCGGPKEYDVTGQVKYNGAVLAKPGGQVIFVSPAGTQASAAINPDGSYRATKVRAGITRVAVYYPNPAVQGKPVGKPKKGEPPPALPPPYLTPDKYATPDSSGLELTVGPGTVFNIDMTGPAIK